MRHIVQHFLACHIVEELRVLQLQAGDQPLRLRLVHGVVVIVLNGELDIRPQHSGKLIQRDVCAVRVIRHFGKARQHSPELLLRGSGVQRIRPNRIHHAYGAVQPAVHQICDQPMKIQCTRNGFIIPVKRKPVAIFKIHPLVEADLHCKIIGVLVAQVSAILQDELHSGVDRTGSARQRRDKPLSVYVDLLQIRVRVISRVKHDIIADRIENLRIRVHQHVPPDQLEQLLPRMRVLRSAACFAASDGMPGLVHDR